MTEDAASGRLTVRTRHGTREVPPAFLSGGVQVGATQDLAELRAQALAAAAGTGVRGVAIPAPIARYVLVRSGGHCEQDGCHEPADHLHHDTRRAWRLDHHPDRLRYLCKAHHDLEHLEQEERAVLSPHASADAAFRRIRAAAGG